MASPAEKAAKAFEQITPLLGLATTIGTAIPGLRKVERRDTSRGRAAEAASRVAGAAVGGAQVGHGATRGLAARTGLRAAGEVAKQTGGELARAGALDDIRYDRQNLIRQGRLRQFGKDAGDYAANVAQSIIEGRQAAAAEFQPPEYEDSQLQNIITGPGAAGLPPEQQGIAETPVMEPSPDVAMGLEDFATQQQLPEVTPLEQLVGLDKAGLYSVAPELQLQHTLENLAITEAERQGINIMRVYARLQRMQNLPAIKAAQERLQLDMEGMY